MPKRFWKIGKAFENSKSGSVKINGIIFREIQIPLQFRFAQSNNTSSTESSSVLIELISDTGISGFGESCPRIYVTGEDIMSVKNDVNLLATSLLGAQIDSIEELLKFFEDKLPEIGPSTICAIEMAWIDLFSKVTNTAVPDLFNIKLDTSLQYSLVLPLIDTEAMTTLLHKISFLKPSSIKIKVDTKTAQHLENIKRIREVFGDFCPIRLDVNGGWSLFAAQKDIPCYLNQGINSFEQPLALGDMEGMQTLMTDFGDIATIMVDESLLHIDGARTMIREKSCNHFNLKISKLGGIFRTKEIYDLASDHGIACQLGAHFGETSLLTAAGILVSGLVGPLSSFEGALGTLLLKEDIVAKAIQQDQTGRVNTSDLFLKPGLRADIQRKSIKDFAQCHVSWPH